MPLTTQALYFHLGLHADDDGIVEAYNVIRMVGCGEDDLRVLAAKGYVKVLNEDLITYIADWSENNRIRPDRKTNSIYQDLLLQILPEAQILEKREKKPAIDQKEPESQTNDGQMTDKCQTNDGQVTDICQPNDRIGKYRLGKDRSVEDRVGKDSKIVRFEALWSLYPRKQGKKAAFNAYQMAIRDGATDEEIRKGIEAYVEYIRESNVAPQYIKQGSSFFNQRAWADDWTPARKMDEYTQRMMATESWGKQYES